ncbi:MAG: HTH-type transcriptional regulator BhcR [Paracoccaceae bacterium]
MPDTLRMRGRPKSFDGKAAQQNTIQSLEGALDLLDVLANADGMTLSELSVRLSRSPSTIYRILNTYSLRSIVEIDPVQQTWHIGPASFRLGSAFLRRSSILERARPVMRSLMEKIGETANLGIEKSNQIVFISQVEAAETIRAFFPPGTQSPLHASGIGKAILAQYSPKRLQQLIAKIPLEKYTPNTITGPEKLIADLETIRTKGYAIDNEEREMGMRCIAAPIIDNFGDPIAGISVSGPTHRMTEDRFAQIGELVSQAGKRLSRGLGAEI